MRADDICASTNEQFLKAPLPTLDTVSGIIAILFEGSVAPVYIFFILELRKQFAPIF